MRLWSCVVLLITALTGSAAGAREVRLSVVLPERRVNNFTESLWAMELGVRDAIVYAIDNINRDPHFLPNHTLVASFSDSKCNDVIGPLVAIDMYYKEVVHAFIGPACPYVVAPIARFSPIWNIPVITGGALVRAFSEKSEYSLLTRLSGAYSQTQDVMLRIMQHIGFKHTATLYANNLNQNALTMGKSDCWFVIEGLYRALLQVGEVESISDYTQIAFDEKEPFNATELLLELSVKTRGEVSAREYI